MSCRIHYKIGSCKSAGLDPACLAGHCSYPGQKFFKSERFDKIVAGTCVKALYPVLHRIPCGQEEHGGIVAFGSHLAKYGQAVHLWHHDIKDDAIIIGHVYIVQRLFSVKTAIYRISFGRQVFCDYLVKILLIFNYKQPHKMPPL